MKQPNTSTPQSITRRNFLKTTALATSAVAFFDLKAMAGPFTKEDFRNLVPLDKKLTPEWLASLTARGAPPIWSGDQLQYIGMPCNGIATGQVYLSGDGRLWYWGQLGKPEGHWKTAGPRYKSPETAGNRLPIQGAALKIGSGSDSRVLPLDRSQCPDTRFFPRWPMGRAELKDPANQVGIEVTGWTPFIPGDVDSSSWPLSVLQYKLENKTDSPLDLDLAVWFRNSVGYSGEGTVAFHRTVEVENLEGKRFVRLGAAPSSTHLSGRENAVLFAGFEDGDYGEWEVSGSAFGSRPMQLSEIPAVQKIGNIEGQGLVNSFAGSDKLTGVLTSPEFLIEKPFINFRVGGGSTRATRVQLVVDDLPIFDASGEDSDVMRSVSWDARDLAGRKGRIKIIDASGGGWGHICVDHIEFSDQPVQNADSADVSLSSLTDFGEMALALPQSGGETYARSFEDLRSVSGLFDEGKNRVSGRAPDRPVAVVGQKVTLDPGETLEVPVIFAWRFEKTPMDELNYYATQWPDTASIVRDFIPNLPELEGNTLNWVDTWYSQSSLPWWLMERALIPADCLQTNTVYRLADRGGRFHLYEGVTCCEGNCTHVWHYAQALAYLFPEIERDCRELIDLEMSQSLDGQMAMRWTNKLFKDAPVDAVDGTSGTILRILREHRMSPDSQFLRRVWPDTKRALEWQIRSYDEDKDGILNGGQHNTLDAAWWGQIPWITGLHLAALQAGAELADEVGDEEFATYCRDLLQKGSSRFNEVFFDPQKGYYVMQEDPNRPDSSGTYEGCHIDQVMGQGWVSLMGLPRVLPEAETQQALQSIWENNFTPDVGPYRKEFPAGRWYSMPGEAGTLLATFPQGGADRALGKGVANHSAYMNETMTGFEWQLAGHMVSEGMLTEGLAVAKAIADRYQPNLRNPFNEIECGDHYGRAMASYGVFLAVCHFSFHGPMGILSYAPKIRPEDFMAPFTAAEGWGSLEQSRTEASQINRITLKHGRLVLNQLNLELPTENAQLSQTLLGNQPLKARIRTDQMSCSVYFEKPVTIHTGETLEIRLVDSLN